MTRGRKITRTRKRSRAGSRACLNYKAATRFGEKPMTMRSEPRGSDIALPFAAAQV